MDSIGVCVHKQPMKFPFWNHSWLFISFILGIFWNVVDYSKKKLIHLDYSKATIDCVNNHVVATLGKKKPHQNIDIGLRHSRRGTKINQTNSSRYINP